MALTLVSPHTPRLLHPPPTFNSSTRSSRTLFLLFSQWMTRSRRRLSSHNPSIAAAATNGRDSASTTLLDEELLRRVSSAKDADQVLDIISEIRSEAGLVETTDCNSIIASALCRGNSELALSVFAEMRRSSAQGLLSARWVWGRPDVETYAVLVRGLAAALRVSDAIKMITCVSRVGVSSGEEVPFGMIVPCPDCMMAIAVAQPQHGIQVASCSKCRYQYELVSGDIVSIESEEIRFRLLNLFPELQTPDK